MTVPHRCYDGAPTAMRVRRSSGTVDTTANAADTGSEPALVLAKRIWQVKQGIRIEETQRHVPPSRG